MSDRCGNNGPSCRRFDCPWPEGRCVDLPPAQADGIHTIPVPRGWSPEQAWEAISRGDDLSDRRPSWANVVIRDGRFVELCDA